MKKIFHDLAESVARKVIVFGSDLWYAMRVEV